MKKNLILLLLISLMFSTSAFSQLNTVVINAPAPGICLGSDIQLNALPAFLPNGEFTGQYLSFSWSSDPQVSFFPSNTASSVYAKPSVTTVFTLTCVDSKFNITKVATTKIVVNNPPNLKIIIPQKDSSSCINQPIDFLGSAYYIKGTPKWTTDGKGQLTVDPDYDLKVKYTPQQGETGIVSVTLSAEPLDFCQSAVVSISRILELVSQPAVTMQSPLSSSSICNKPLIPLPLKGTVSNATSYEWRVDPDTAGVIANKKELNTTFMPNPKFQGVARIYLDAWNKGCMNSALGTVTVTKFDVSVFSSKNNNLCAGEKDTLEVGACSGCTYKWNTNETTRRIIVSPTQNTSFIVEVTNQEGCFSKDTINIKVLPSPPTPLVAEDKAEKKITITPDNMELYTFAIKGNKVQESTNNEFGYRNYISVADTINISITNDVGCSSDTIFKIPKMICVDAFSPNGDGINDLLLQGRKITVFDRTQKILYQGWDGWDGRLNGREMPEGTYFYILFNEDNTVFCKTPVTLLRSLLAK